MQIGLVLQRAMVKLRSIAKALHVALGPQPCSVLGGFAADMLRSRFELLAENVILRQQLIVAARKVKRPIPKRHERALITLLAAEQPRWRDALLLVKPATVLRWRRAGFACFVAGSPDRRKPPVSRMSPNVVELIQRLARENRLWGAERIRGELLELGIYVSKRTIHCYMRASMRRSRREGELAHVPAQP